MAARHADHLPLAPAFDLTYANNPAGVWTARHQMSVDGRREDITRDDLRALAATATMKRGRADAIIDQVRSAVLGWSEFADAAGVDESQVTGVAAGHRPDL